MRLLSLVKSPFRTGIGILWLCLCSVTYAGPVSLLMPAKEMTLDKTADADVAGRLKLHVERVVNGFGRRSHLDLGNQKKVADYLEAELKNAGCVTSRQNVVAGRKTFQNILGIIPGKSNRKVIIGAHYDSCELTPGADDNASGVAGLLELARMLAGANLEHTIELVAYCNEEPPYFDTDAMGSLHHARLVHSRKDKVTLMICLEMIGYYSDKPNSQHYPDERLKQMLPSTGNFIGVVGNVKSLALSELVQKEMSRAGSLPVARANLPENLGITLDYSDHRNYWKYGYPAIMITDTSFYRNPHYHRKSDTPETLDYRRMSDVVLSLFKSILLIDKQ